MQLADAKGGVVGWGWLVRWRWLMLVAGAVAALVGALSGVTAEGGGGAAVLVALAASNLWLGQRAVGAAVLGWVLAFDTLGLTAMLAISGGPSNPFSILYMVQVTLAAVVLGARWTAAIVVLSVGCFGGLFVLGSPHAMMGHAHGGFTSHLQGMFVAFALTASAIAFLVTRIARALRERDEELAVARQAAARSEHVAALTTLAAGAAHELGTPLGTIAIAARELEHQAARHDDPDLVDDAQLIREEVARCRRILDQMHATAAEEGGEAARPVPVEDLLDAVVRAQPEARRGRLRVERVDEPGRVAVPAERFAKVLGDLVDNAFDAVPAGEVTLVARRSEGAIRFEVRDEGPGMDAAVLRRACDPFFTTKEAGKGMGLGLFLAQVLVDRLGGRLELESTPGGTCAALEVPA